MKGAAGRIARAHLVSLVHILCSGEERRRTSCPEQPRGSTRATQEKGRRWGEVSGFNVSLHFIIGDVKAAWDRLIFELVKMIQSPRMILTCQSNIAKYAIHKTLCPPGRFWNWSRIILQLDDRRKQFVCLSFNVVDLRLVAECNPTKLYPLSKHL